MENYQPYMNCKIFCCKIRSNLILNPTLYGYDNKKDLSKKAQILLLSTFYYEKSIIVYPMSQRNWG